MYIHYEYMKTAVITIRIDPRLKREALRHAHARDVTLSYVVNTLLREFTETGNITPPTEKVRRAQPHMQRNAKNHKRIKHPHAPKIYRTIDAIVRPPFQ